MSSPKIYKKSSYYLNDYISNLDLINKYNLNEKKKVPFLDKITVELSLAQFVKNFGDTNKTVFHSEIQIRSILMLYLLVHNVPLIRFKKSEIKIKKSMKTGKDTFSLCFSITDRDLINQFLIRLFFEQKGFLISDLRHFRKRDINFNNHCLRNEKFVYSTFVLSQNFLEVDNYFNRVLIDSNPNELSLKLNLNIFNPSVKSNFKNTIKNLPFFWVNG